MAAKDAVFAGGGGLSVTGGWLPGAGNGLPLEAGPWCLLAALLRAGLPPASLKAAAKSWPAARIFADAAEAGASGWTASLKGGA